MPSTLRRTSGGVTDNTILFLLSELYGNCSSNYNASRPISINRPTTTDANIGSTSLSQSGRIILNVYHNLIELCGTYNKEPHYHNGTPSKDNPNVLLDRTADNVETHQATSPDTHLQQRFKTNHVPDQFFTAPFLSSTKAQPALGYPRRELSRTCPTRTRRFDRMRHAHDVK